LDSFPVFIGPAAVLGLPLKKPVLFEHREKFAEIRFYDSAACSVLLADFIHDLTFGASFLEEFENAGAYKVEAEYLAVKDIQHDRSVLVVKAADARRESLHWNAPLVFRETLVRCVGAWHGNRGKATIVKKCS
jgi:hypothetical protein